MARSYLQVLGEIGNIQEDIPQLRWNRYHHAVFTGELVPGCRVCMRRALSCIHIGLRCNLDCTFCPLESRVRHYSPEEDAQVRAEAWEGFLAQSAQGRVEGVSFTGGEPLLYLDELEAYAQRVLERLPEAHLWLYTNGLLASKEVLQRVRASGIQEIRLNLAATGFSKQGLRTLALAREIFAYVVVEIPTYPPQAKLLLESLEELAAIGIDQLNMQELVITPANIHRVVGEVYSIGEVNLLYGSRLLTYKVIRRCLERDYPFTCVDCSAGIKYLLDHATLLGF